MVQVLGVDITNSRTEEEWDKDRPNGWEVWESKIIGLANYPYHTCQAMNWSKGGSLRNRNYPNNPYVWEIVMNNLPGEEFYDCIFPWVYTDRSDVLKVS